MSANDIVGPIGFAPCHIHNAGIFRKIRNKTKHTGGSLIQFEISTKFENILRGPLIIQYFIVRQLAGPYFIRPAHGPDTFLEAPLRGIPRPLDENRPFFPDVDPGNMTSAVRKKFDRVPGYAWVTFRSFRDYGATLASRNGIPDKVTQKMMGQKDVRSTQPYIMADDQNLRDARQVLDKASVCKRSASPFESKEVMEVNR